MTSPRSLGEQWHPTPVRLTRAIMEAPTDRHRRWAIEYRTMWEVAFHKASRGEAVTIRELLAWAGSTNKDRARAARADALRCHEQWEKRECSRTDLGQVSDKLRTRVSPTNADSKRALGQVSDKSRTLARALPSTITNYTPTSPGGGLELGGNFHPELSTAPDPGEDPPPRPPPTERRSSALMNLPGPVVEAPAPTSTTCEQQGSASPSEAVQVRPAPVSDDLRDADQAPSPDVEDIPSSSVELVHQLWAEAHEIAGMGLPTRSRKDAVKSQEVADRLRASPRPVTPSHLRDALVAYLHAWQDNTAWPPRVRRPGSARNPSRPTFSHLLDGDEQVADVQLDAFLERTAPANWWITPVSEPEPEPPSRWEPTEEELALIAQAEAVRAAGQVADPEAVQPGEPPACWSMIAADLQAERGETWWHINGARLVARADDAGRLVLWVPSSHQLQQMDRLCAVNAIASAAANHGQAVRFGVLGQPDLYAVQAEVAAK